MFKWITLCIQQLGSQQEIGKKHSSDPSSTQRWGDFSICHQPHGVQFLTASDLQGSSYWKEELKSLLHKHEQAHGSLDPVFQFQSSGIHQSSFQAPESPLCIKHNKLCCSPSSNESCMASPWVFGAQGKLWHWHTHPMPFMAFNTEKSEIIRVIF